MNNVIPLRQRTTPLPDGDATPPAYAPDRDETTQGGTVTATVTDARRVVYTVPEVAQMLSLSRGSTYTMIRSGQIPAMKLGARWVIPKKRFHAWLDSLTHEGGNQ